MDGASGPQRSGASSAATSPTKTTILVIDDNRSIVELVRHVLTLQGRYHVVVAYDGAGGLAQFYEHRPQCVIVDVRMPGIDGYQVVRAIRGDAESADTPLIILSALTQRDYRMMGLLSGVDEYLPKPFKPSELCATLDRVLKITPEERMRRLTRLAADDDGDDSEDSSGAPA